VVIYPVNLATETTLEEIRDALADIAVLKADIAAIRLILES
jgi:hypothetical protein